MGNRATHTLSCPVIVEYPPSSRRIVLVGEPKKGNTLNFPGGGVDLLKNNDSETLITAAIREAKEESGLDVKITGIVGLNHVLKERKFHFTLAATAIGGSLEASIQHPVVYAASIEEIEELNSSDRLRSPRVQYWAKKYLDPSTELMSLDLLREFEADPFPLNGGFPSLGLK
jgi:8-oxo-dGTP pyrophosphatase MutT (NUDIX family)